MAILRSKVGKANNNGEESQTDSVSVWPSEDEGMKSREALVRLPTVDLRQPKKDGAKTEVATPGKIKNLKYSLAYSRLFPFEPPFRVKLPTTTSPINSHDQSSRNEPSNFQPPKNKTRLPFTRGSRGRGDYRNARMRAERIRWEAEQQVIRQIAHSSTLQSSTALSDTMPAYMSLTSQGPSPQRHRLNRNTTNVRNEAPLPGRSSNAPHRSSAPGPLALPRFQKQLNGPVARRQDDWTTWIELSIRVAGLTSNVSTRDLWKAFSNEGSIATIELYEDSKGNRDGKGVIRFSPPPTKPFWQATHYSILVEGEGTLLVRLELMQPRRSFLIPSPVDSQSKYPEIMVLKAESVDFGFMYGQTTMMGMYKAVSTPQSEILFRQNMHHREVTVEFQINIRDPRPVGTQVQTSQVGKHNRTEIIRFSIPFSQLQVIHRVEDDQNKMTLLVSMQTPPRFFRKGDEINTHEDNGRYWSQNDAWYRQTDIVYARSHLKYSPLTLKKTQSIIDIGRWTTYCFVFDMLKNNRPRFGVISNAFRDHNVEIKDFSGFKLMTKREPAVWEYIDKAVKSAPPTHALDELMIEDNVPQLSFPVRYQLEVCISQGYLNEHNMTKDFVNKLITMDVTKAQDVLEYVANQKRRIYDPMEIFSMIVTKGLASRPKIPYYCVYIRSVTVTPSTVYYNTPTVETSNRVIRQYFEHADRFLRVRFTDEKFEGRINPTHKQTMNEVFTRIYRTMVNGIVIGDRRYEFLAFGNSQFREHGAYFIAPLPHFSASAIRRWMGSFKEIKIVAKYAARLGQCFSTTRAISGAKASITEIMDIERNGFNFTDGVGKISTFLAQLAASELGIPPSFGGPPSVFQFRLGGCKGVLAISPESKAREIHIRPSQYKFPAIQEGLEIIRWSQFAVASLNRQLIAVLSALGVPDETFTHKLKMQLSNLEQAMTDEKLALSLLQKDIDANQMTLVVAGMVLDGFQKARDPFVTSLLQLWRAWSIKYLKEKARITITDGALLLGCIDETATLKGHFNRPSPVGSTTDDKSEESLPEVFVQISKGPDDKPLVIKGPMLLGRNPSLHPGDLRVVRGVDITALHHLRDAVVFPQTGDRDIPSMCSGGDLDGDDFLVMWDEDLLPRDWNDEPMDYKAPEPAKLDREVTTTDITSFFVQYMKNDALPKIAHAHLALADFTEDGVRDEKCLRLAALHSMAVDYVKTGEPAIMPRDLSPRKWPHFMEKKHKTKDQIYVSQKVLGRLYDQVERVDFVPAFSAPFDRRVLNAYDLDEDILHNARDLKVEYDTAMHRVMAQHEIKTEFEVWSTFVLHHAGDSKDYKFHEVIGELSNALKHQFRDACYQKAGGKEFEHIGPFVAAMYTITFFEMDQALKECRQKKYVGGHEEPVRKMKPESMPLISFPWLFHGILGKIANGATDLWPGQEIGTKKSWQRESKRTQSKKGRVDAEPSDEEDIVQTAEGVTHRGEVLELFENLIDYEQDEPNVAPRTKSSPAHSGSTGKGADISVDYLLFGDPTEDFVAFEKNVPGSKSSLDTGSDSLMGSPSESRVISTRAKNDERQLGSKSQSTGGVTTGISRSRSSLYDKCSQLAEEFGQSAGRSKLVDRPKKAPQPLHRNSGGSTPENTDFLRSEASSFINDVQFSAGNSGSFNISNENRHGQNPLEVESDRMSLQSSDREIEVKAAENESQSLSEVKSEEVDKTVDESESESGESESESEEEIVHIDIPASLIDSLIKLNED